MVCRCVQVTTALKYAVICSRHTHAKRNFQEFVINSTIDSMFVHTLIVYEEADDWKIIVMH